MATPDLLRSRNVHVLGAGGAAMSAIAVILARMGHRVTGSDQVESATLDRLRAEGIEVWAPHDVARIGNDVDLAAISAAIREENRELTELRSRGVEVATRSDVMEALGGRKRTVAISGTAGKTTTAAMAALVFDGLGLRPSMIVGSTIDGLGNGVAWTGSEWFVVEADESDGSFLRFHADNVVVTNLAPDHLDYWGTMANLEEGFDRFARQAAGPKIINADDVGTRAMLARLRGTRRLVTFGFADDADYRITDFEASGLTSRFVVRCPGGSAVPVALAVPGAHNASNATAALVVATEVADVAERPSTAAAAAEILGRYRGAGRRFEHRGVVNGVTFVDDYAHLPGKARAAVDAALAGGWSRVVAVYEPHRYTRTRDLWKDYADSFTGVDLLVVTGIYPAGQKPIDGVTGELVADAVRAAHPDARVEYCETRSELVALLEQELRPGDVCLTMNAGDLTTLPDEMAARPWAGGES